MTRFGSGTGRSSTNASGGEDEHREGHISVKDNRRIDPKTGQVRAAPGSVPQPGSAAANPGDPANAGQPITAPPAASEELATARAETAERTADLQRLSAEYANYRKRVERDRLAAGSAGKAAVIAELLGVCDDLDRAGEHGDLVGGFKNVADKFTGVLERAGLSRYGAQGDEFDPNVHEAVQFATSPDVDHPTVTTVLRVGYLFEERVLRPAVVVVTGPEHEAPASGSADAAPGSASGDGAAGFGSPEDPVVVSEAQDVGESGAGESSGGDNPGDDSGEGEEDRVDGD